MSNASNVESSKTLAGLGSILLILTPIPYAGVVLGIIGAILLLIGIKGLASYYQDNGIYENAVMGVVFLIIAVIAFAVAIAALAIGFATLIGFRPGHPSIFGGFGHCFRFLSSCSHALKKNFRHACTEIGRTIVYDRRDFTLVGRHSDNSSCWLYTDIPRLDICHCRLLLHESATATTLFFTTVRLATAICSSNSLAHCNSNDDGTLLP